MKLRRIEWIIATAIWIFILILIYGTWSRYTELYRVLSNLGYATVIYLGFMAFGWLSDHYFKQRRIEMGIVWTSLLFFAMWCSLAALLWMMDGMEGKRSWWSYISEGRSLGVSLVSFLCFIAYEILKAGILYFRKQQGSLTWRVGRELSIVVGVGIPIFLLLMFVNPDVAAFWLLFAPYAYLVFALHVYWILPLGNRSKQRLWYGLLGCLGSLILFLPIGLIYFKITHSSTNYFFPTWIGNNMLILPIAYYVYATQKASIMELTNLKLELGRSSADALFLRSQINPHFLFNILNTLYGTALQEQAERTAMGIQKLGDMMRFMLHENHEDRILLVREIDYLRNYIDLQVLRTATSPDIQVNCDIQDSLDGDYIAPMLLIPFVENAFKHGISLREKSWIQISVRHEEGKLFFDVYNSVHSESSLDPERDHNGIGLENVKQRLNLMYPKLHELVIRQTAREFFVHLTLQLN